MRFRSAFTLIELVFVIVIMGIIGKFGVEFLAEAYKTYIFTSVSNTLQSQSATAVEFISTRLQHRIKDSIIARVDANQSFTALGSATGDGYDVLEWVSADVDGFRGNSDATPNLPNWSGIADIDLSNNALIVSPETNTSKIDTLITVLSSSGSGINDAALYFVGSNSDIVSGYGWSGAITDQNQTMHPINTATNLDEFNSTIGNFSEIYEYYKLAWTAYAIRLDNTTKELTLYYDYQPWNGDTYSLKADGNLTKSALIMQNVETFQFMAVGSLVKIQVCVNNDLVEDYSLCKEKTIY